MNGFVIRSGNGVTASGYKTRKAANEAARRANEEAPGQGWYSLAYENAFPNTDREKRNSP